MLAAASADTDSPPCPGPMQADRKSGKLQELAGTHSQNSIALETFPSPGRCRKQSSPFSDSVLHRGFL